MFGEHSICTFLALANRGRKYSADRHQPEGKARRYNVPQDLRPPKKLSLQHGRRNKVEKVHTSRSQERKIAENILSPSPSLHLLFSFPYDEEDGKMETIARRKVSEGKEENIITLHCLIS